MSKYRQEQPVKSEKGYADISPSGRVGLLDVVFSRIIYGFGAMIIVGLPFSIWFFYLGKNPLGLLLWVINYLFSLLLVRRLYRHFCQAREALDPELLLQRWIPRINALALYYGSTMLVPALLTGGQANFEFQLVYLGTVAAIVAGKTAAYGGATTAVVSGMSLSEMGIIVGAIVGVLGLIFGQYWAWRKDRREAREMEARMQHKFGTGWDEL